MAALGRLDALIVCAGVLVEAELAEIRLEDREQAIAVNLRRPARFPSRHGHLAFA